jgi:hypothetical protein
MDFNLPITYQIAGSSTINLNSIAASEVTTTAPLSGYKVLSANFGDVALTGYVDKRALHDGVDAADAYLGTKQISIVCGVFGSSMADFHDKIQALMDAARPVPREYQENYGFRDLCFSQATIDTANFTSGYIPMAMKVRPTSIPGIQLTSAQSIGVSSKGFAANVQLSFMAKKPYKFLQTERSITISGSTATTTFPNLGSAIVYPMFEIIYSTSITYAAVTTTSATFTFDGVSLKLNGLDFSAKNTNQETRWYIDFDNQTVYRGLRSSAGGAFVKTLRQDVIDTTTYLFGAIPPTDDSVTTMTINYGGSNKPAQVIVTYTEAWY